MTSPCKPNASPNGRPLLGIFVQFTTMPDDRDTCLIQPSEQAANNALPDFEVGAKSSGYGSSPSPTRSNCNFSTFGHLCIGNGIDNSVGHGSMCDAFLTMLCHVSITNNATNPQNTSTTPSSPVVVAMLSSSLLLAVTLGYAFSFSKLQDKIPKL